MSKTKKPLVIGITGGIGSGKTTICNIFNFLGIPHYNADVRASILQNTNTDIISETTKLFGDKAYVNNKLNKSLIRERIFSDNDLLLKLNNIVHPRIKQDFINWEVEHNKNPYLLKESAILFESNAHLQTDKVITVIAEEETRIQRVLKRDELDRKTIESIIKKQITDQKKVELSDYIIDNNGTQSILKQVISIHEKIMLLKGI